MLSTRLIAAPVLATTLILAVGCEIQPESVPPDATIVTKGSDDLMYTAPSDGTIYVYEENSDRLLYSGKVEAGDVVSLDPDRRRLTVDGKVAFEKDLSSVRNHVIRFQPDDNATERTVILRRSTVERDLD